jgi:hypothetical protein
MAPFATGTLMKPTISKSKFLAGLQCSKLLWHHYNAPDAFPPIDAAKQAIFDIGHRVGDLAKGLHPDGEEVRWNRDLSKTTAETQKLLLQRKPIFEASFEVDGCYCRADIMVPKGGDAWDLYEVKSATKVKDINIADVAFQTHVIERSGITLDRLFLVHIDNSYVRQGDIDPAGIFHAEDVTSQARALQSEVESKVAAMHGTIAGDCPNTPIGEHCSEPYDCDLWEQCSQFLPKFDVGQLYRARKKKVFELIAKGITDLGEVPPSELSPGQLVQQQVIQSGHTYVEREPIRAWLDGLEYPLHCFDFETMNPAVPLFDGTCPYQQIPFQFSLHILEKKGAVPHHVEFLAESPGDPRPALLEALSAIGPMGTILAYNMGFERRILRELSEDFPAHRAFLADLDGRFQDLITPFNNFWYYNAEQRGSCSLKYVLPVLTGTTYEGMEISEGGQAMREYIKVVYGDVSDEEKARILDALRMYCRQDTKALIDILDGLQALLRRTDT